MNHKLSISVGLVCLGLGSLNASAAAPPIDRQVIHAVNRLSFGPRPGDLETVQKMGVEAYLQQQLHPQSLPEPPALTQQLAQLETLNLTPLQLFEQTRRPKLAKGQTLTPEQKKADRQQRHHVLEQATHARLLRATASPRQLQEVMVDFWYNHFNVFDRKGVDQLLVGTYEQTAIRPQTLGRFRDLLGATAHHPAMLFYLDNWQNTAPHPVAKQGKQPRLNENYARELMELHTLGVEGGYTQQDVIALAKIFTGWTFRRTAQTDVEPNGFYFDAKRHDFSDKVFLGQSIKGSGQAEGEQALDILAKSPATAHHISYKLAQYFVADQPPDTLVDQLAQKFLATDGNIGEVLSTLFHSAAFQAAYRAKFKTPYQYAISAVRSTGLDVQNFRPVNSLLQQLGMPLYGCPTPDGYKNTEAAWLNADAMTRRLSFATALASGRLPLTTLLFSEAASSQRSQPMSSAVTPIAADQLAHTLGLGFSVETQQAIAASPAHLRAALMLGSPEFMRR